MSYAFDVTRKYSGRIIEKVRYWPFKYFFNFQGIILGFHRIRPRSDFRRLKISEELEITPEKFETIIQYFIEKGFSFISLDDLIKNRINTKFIIITFDDGYYDNYEYAHPILKRFNIPYNVYISNSLMGNSKSLWWYKLEELVLKNDIITFSEAPGISELQINCRTEKEKQLAFIKLRNIIFQHLDNPDNYIINSLYDSLNTDNTFTELYKMLDSKTLKEYARDPLVTIGAHTVNHLNLGLLKYNELTAEIVNSKNELEASLLTVIKHFSLPYGMKPDNSITGIEEVIRDNFATCTTTDFGYIFRRDDLNLHALPRIFLSPGYVNRDLDNIIFGIDHFLSKIFRS